MADQLVVTSKFRYPKTVACLAGMILLTAVATMLFRLQSTSGDHQAVLYVANPIVELGVLSPGNVREIALPIANKGGRRLIIHEMDESCECGSPIKRTILIPPGVTKKVKVLIDTRFATGAIESTTSFTTNDRAQPHFDLIVRAWVLQSEQLEPVLAPVRQ